MTALPVPPPDDFEGAPIEALAKLQRDVRAAGSLLGRDEARTLVKLYYSLQQDRIDLAGTARAATKAERSAEIVQHFGGQMHALEKQMVGVLGAYSMASEVGRWSREQHGVGPIIAAGFLAHIDIMRAPTVGAIWRFAGLDPTSTWGKGERRPWNADLKVLCWKLGESFKKFHNADACFYGHIYAQRKAAEVDRNERGLFADQAAQSLATKKFGDNDTRAAYEQGKLPPGRLDLRATRYAVKLFLAHWHEVAYWEAHGEAPPRPYVLEHGPDGLGHAHKIEPPHWVRPS